MSCAVELRHVSVSYQNHLALRDISLDVDRGDFLGIIGPNGAGKTTLLTAINGLGRVHAGTVRVLGEPATRGSLVRLRCRIGYVPQEQYIDPRAPITAYEAVLMGRFGRLGLLRPARAADRARARQAMELVDIAALAERPVGRLSGGEKQKTALARALAQVGDLAVLSLFSVLLPKAGTCHTANATRSFLMRYSLPLVMGCTACSVLLILISPFLRLVLRFTFGEEFTRATVCLAVLLFGTLMALWGVPASATVYSLGRSRLIAFLEGLKLLIFVVAAAFLAPRYGILGMAWTTVVAKGTISVLTMVCAWWTTDARRSSGGQATEPRLEPAVSE
uniref:ATP-binding cassette domain-containing protein n=1 Tax=candidate division WOR-3 bacterium TaxID=2052148 RepID=A0A7C4CEG0_UNCW3